MGSQAYNVILAGSYGVGKSTLFEHLSRREREGGVGKSCRAWDKWSHVMTIDGEQVQVVLWDTADMEQSGLVNMSRTYFSQCVGVILVYDKGNLSSLFDLKDWVRRVEDSQWASSLVLSLWCNDTGEYPNEVTEENRTDFTQTCSHPIPTHLVFDVNAKEGCNVDESYRQVIAAIHQKWTAASCSTSQGTGSKITLSSHDTQPQKRCPC